MELYNPIPPIEQAYFRVLTIKDEKYRKDTVSYFFRQRLKPMLVTYILILALFVRGAVSAVNAMPEYVEYAFIPPVFVTAFFVFILLSLRQAMINQFTASPANRECRAAFFENCIVIQDASSSVTMRYESVTSVIEIRDYFYICPSGGNLFIVAKSGFELGYPEQLASFLQSKLCAKYRKKF